MTRATTVASTHSRRRAWRSSAPSRDSSSRSRNALTAAACSSLRCAIWDACSTWICASSAWSAKARTTAGLAAISFSNESSRRAQFPLLRSPDGRAVSLSGAGASLLTINAMNYKHGRVARKTPSSDSRRNAQVDCDIPILRTNRGWCEVLVCHPQIKLSRCRSIFRLLGLHVASQSGESGAPALDGG